MKQKSRFGLLAVINAGMFFFTFFFGFFLYTDRILLIPVLCQLALTWVNSRFTHSCSRMLVLDAISLIMTAAGVFLLSGLYASMYWETPGMTEAPVITGGFFLPWLCLEFVFVCMACVIKGYVRRKKLWLGVTAAGAVCFFSVSGLYVYLLFASFPYEKADHMVSYEQIIQDNGTYRGYITDAYQVVIEDMGGKRNFVRTMEELEMMPSLIALGEQYFYVYGWDLDQRRKLVQFDYQGNTVNERKMKKELYSLAYRDNILFFGELDEEDYRYGYETVDGFYANCYLMETDFKKGKILPCKADESGLCRIGNTVLYLHDAKNFSTNPQILEDNDSRCFHLLPGEGWEDATEWEQLVDDLLQKKGWRRQFDLEGMEYQKGTRIYGVVNASSDSVMGISRRRVKSSLAYRIDCEKKTIDFTREWDGIWLILTSENCVVYQEGTKIIREDLQTGKKECLAELKDDLGDTYNICGDYIEYYEGEKEKWVKWAL